VGILPKSSLRLITRSPPCLTGEAGLRIMRSYNLFGQIYHNLSRESGGQYE